MTHGCNLHISQQKQNSILETIKPILTKPLHNQQSVLRSNIMNLPLQKRASTENSGQTKDT